MKMGIKRMLHYSKKSCAICRTKFKDSKNKHQDHCHTTERNRSFLCRSCNIGLGNFKDDTRILKRAVKYLNFWQKEHKNQVYREGFKFVPFDPTKNYS